MGRYDGVTVLLKSHALKQYSERVEPIEADNLRELCEEQIRKRDVSYDAGDWLHLAGVWWIYLREADVMTFVTCYGRSSMDMPKAVAWAMRNHDRINLHDLIDVEEG